MGGLDLGVFELRSMFVRGETIWMLQELTPWSEVATVTQVPEEAAPVGVDDPARAQLVEELFARLDSLGRRAQGPWRSLWSTGLACRISATSRRKP